MGNGTELIKEFPETLSDEQMQRLVELERLAAEKWGEIRQPRRGLKPALVNWLLADPRESLPPIGAARAFLVDVLTKPEEGAREVERRFLAEAINAAALGLPYQLLQRPSPPKTTAQAVASGLGELAGFAAGPLKIAGKVAPRIPVLGKAVFSPSATRTQALVKPVARTALTLGTASALRSPEHKFRSFVEGNIHGSVLSSIGYIPNTPLRLITSAVYLGLPSTLRAEPLEMQVFSYGLGALIGGKKLEPGKQWLREHHLMKRLVQGEPKAELLRQSEQLIDQFKARAERFTKPPTTRKEHFHSLVSARPHYAPLYEGWRKEVASKIMKRVKELRSHPFFPLETGDVQFIADYIAKDIGSQRKLLKELTDAQLLTAHSLLSSYRPPEQHPFSSPPPLKPEYARSLGQKIHLGDVSLRLGYPKLKKLGFGEPFQEGSYARQVFTADKERLLFLRDYLLLRNNWLRAVGLGKARARDLLRYLEGKLPESKLRRLHGETAVQVAKQMRKFYDTLLELHNRYNTAVGEEPIRRLEDYATHVFKEKRPLPEEVQLALSHLPAKRKFFPFARERRGVPGYEENIWTALDTYAFSSAERLSDSPIRAGHRILQHLERAIKSGDVYSHKIDLEGIHSNLKRFVEGLQRRPGWLDKYIKATLPKRWADLETMSNHLASLIYYGTMGWRVDLPLRNLCQQSLIIARTGFKPLIWAIRARGKPEARKLLNQSEVVQTRSLAFVPEAEDISTLGGRLHRLGRGSLKLYKWSDIVNVENAFLAGYKYARAKGMSHEQAVRFGDKVAYETQFLYLRSNRSDLARLWGISSSLGRLASVFTHWPSAYIEFLIGSAQPENRAQLIKYLAAALLGTVALTAMGAKGWEYFGYTSPLQLAKFPFKLPISGVAERPSIIALKKLKRVLDGDADLKTLFLRTFEQ